MHYPSFMLPLLLVASPSGSSYVYPFLVQFSYASFFSPIKTCIINPLLPNEETRSSPRKV